MPDIYKEAMEIIDFVEEQDKFFIRILKKVIDVNIYESKKGLKRNDLTRLQRQFLHGIIRGLEQIELDKFSGKRLTELKGGIKNESTK